jgi:hypothetical protein
LYEEGIGVIASHDPREVIHHLTRWAERRGPVRVAADLGHVYPLELDRRVTAYVREIRALAHDTVVQREQESR